MCNPFVCINGIVISLGCHEKRLQLKMTTMPQFYALFEIILKKVGL